MRHLQALTATVALWCQTKLWGRRTQPNMLFPVRNKVTGTLLWFQVLSSPYGVSVIVHRNKPHIDSLYAVSPQTGMAGVHVDYYVAAENGEQEQIKVQLFDETRGPYDEAHWEMPQEYSARFQDVSVVLVRDVQMWVPPSHEE